MIEAVGLSKTYPSDFGEPFNLSIPVLRLYPAQLLAILGTNGAGKSTLLKLLARAESPDSGDIRLVEETADHAPFSIRERQLRPYYLDQNSAMDVVPSMSVVENLCLEQIQGRAGSLRWPSRRRARSEARLALAKVAMGLDQRLSDQARALSGGQRQGLVVARMLLSRSRILLLDEFASSLTAELANRLMELIKGATEERRAYCAFVTHNLALAFRHADAFVFLHKGRVAAQWEKNSPLVQQEILALFDRSFHEVLPGG